MTNADITADTPKMTPIQDLAQSFVTSARSTSDQNKAGQAFKDAVETITSERGWENESAARSLISSIQHASKRDMQDPRSFLAMPLKEVNVGRLRTSEQGEKVENTIDDIKSEVSSQTNRYAKAISHALESLDFEQ